MKDPTKFKQRFDAWKNGKKPYNAGRPKDDYEQFLETLPENQKQSGAYNTRRYWELNGKPKNFAEAIGRGMYSVQEDDGKLGWHANSVAYDVNKDRYEFMKPNYHDTRWMEQVYGYNQSPEFQKEYKVEYNGPMLSDRYVRREKPGFKVVGGKLPTFRDGKSAEYVQGGKDNSWTRVTNDPMGAVFQDLVVRPQSRGGNTTVGNWERQWSPKYEKPLETVSPEFDIISGVRGLIGMLPKKAVTITTKNAAKITPKQWDEAYMSAITNNDAKEVQRLRDLHFKIKAPKSKAIDANGMPTKQYHTVADGYPAEFNEFNPNIEGTHSSIYTSDSPIMSGTYSSKIVSDAEREYYINSAIQNMKQQLKEGYVSGVYKKEMEAALESDASSRAYVLNKLPWLKLPTQAVRQKALYANIENPLIIEGAGRHWNSIPINNLPKDVYKALKSSQMNGYTTRDIELAQKLTGNYDGAIIRNITDYGSSWKSTTSSMKPSTVYQINDPRNLKYTDPITYDNAGKIIPLSQRDNFNIADLRYGVIPALIGGSTYQMYR